MIHKNNIFDRYCDKVSPDEFLKIGINKKILKK